MTPSTWLPLAPRVLAASGALVVQDSIAYVACCPGGAHDAVWTGQLIHDRTRVDVICRTCPPAPITEVA